MLLLLPLELFSLRKLAVVRKVFLILVCKVLLLVCKKFGIDVDVVNPDVLVDDDKL